MFFYCNEKKHLYSIFNYFFPQVQKKQLSGKKVRTLLMDLLKGCGDFRTPNTGKINKQPNTAGRDFNKPEIIVTPCTPRASYSNQSQSMEK